MKRGKCKGPIKPWKKRKVDESPKNNGEKRNDTDIQVGNETDLSVERKDCSRSGYWIDHRRWKHDYSVELEKWLMSRKTKGCKGPVKETENEREEERKFISSLLFSGMEKEKECISPFKEPDQSEKNGVSNYVGRTDNKGDGNVESDEEEVVVRKHRRTSSCIVTKGLS